VEGEVFVANCAETITDDDIRTLFEDVGTITNIKWLTKNDSFSGKGFVKFSSLEAVEKAVALDGSEVNGQAISITVPVNATRSSSAPGTTNTIFLGRVSDSATDDDVRALFGDCGEITGIRWGTKDGQFAGYGFVEFADPSAVDKAVELAGADLAGRAVNIDRANQRDGGGGGRGGGRGGFGGGRGGGRGGFGGDRGGRGGGFGGRGGFGGDRGGRGGFGGRGGGFGGGRGGRGGFGGDRGGRGGGFGGGGRGGFRGARTTF